MEDPWWCGLYPNSNTGHHCPGSPTHLQEQVSSSEKANCTKPQTLWSSNSLQDPEAGSFRSELDGGVCLCLDRLLFSIGLAQDFFG